MEYLLVKWVHVLSSTLLFGTGLGSAYYMFFTNRSRDTRAIAVVCARVVKADWTFTAPTGILQPLSGAYLLHLAGIPWTARWVAVSIGLYVVAMLCWLPVVWLQIRMAAMARTAADSGSELPERFWRFHRLWTALGIPAFAGFLGIFHLMVFKPV